VSGAAISPQVSTVTAKVFAPNKVGAGKTFSVGVAFEPGPANGPIAIDPGLITYTVDLDVVSDGVASTKTSAGVTNPTAIPPTFPGGVVSRYIVPIMVTDLVAPTRVGAVVTTAPNKLKLAIPSLNTSVACTRVAVLGPVSSTIVAAGDVIAATTTTQAPQTTAPPTAPETTGPKTVSTLAPLAPGAGLTSQIVTKTAQISMECDITVSGSSLTPQTGLVTALVSAPDRVAPGSTYNVTIAFDPGPKNGPIRFAPGQVSYSAELAISGGGTPGKVMTSNATNPDVVSPSKLPNGPNVYHQVPSLVAKVTAPATSGATVGISPSKLIITIPLQDSTTSCKPTGAQAVVASSQVVAGVSAPAAVRGFTGTRSGAGGTSVKGATLARTGSDADTQGLFATALLLSGLALVAIGRRRQLLSRRK